MLPLLVLVCIRKSSISDVTVPVLLFIPHCPVDPVVFCDAPVVGGVVVHHEEVQEPPLFDHPKVHGMVGLEVLLFQFDTVGKE